MLLALDHDEYMRWTVYYQRIAQRQELEQLKAEARARG